MSASAFDVVPDPLRASARSAIGAVAGQRPVSRLERVTGGASGAATYRVDVAERSYLLRIESGLNARTNPNHYACMRAAAEAGVAPRLHFSDPDHGVAVMDFVTQQPLQSYPGGPPALVSDLGALIRRLQGGAVFPPAEIRYTDLVRRMLEFVVQSRVFADGLLARHVEGFERIRATYPWNDAALVSSHNDPNPRNILFDGTRLWLVDWETAYQNDPLTDVAVVTHELAPTPELQQHLLRSWLGRAPDRATEARLVLMRQVSRMFFACALLRHFANIPGRAPASDLKSLTPQEFVSAIQTGRLRLGTPEVLYEFGKMFLAGFLDELTAPGFEDALAASRAG